MPTIGDIARKVLHPRARILFLSILFLALTLVLAVFGVAIAKVFKAFPMAIFPSLVQIPLAMGIGAFIHRKGKNLLPASLAVLTLMYLSVWFGDSGFLHAFNASLASMPTIVWVAFLLLYSYAASVLPVWLLLQPRDYINSLQLLSTLGLIVIGLVATPFLGHSREIIAPAIDSGKASTLPLMFPFLFITIACGAVSGFHCLVSSGTTSKQIRCESDAQFVGYGSMLTEGFLAVIVILACVAGLGLGENPDIWSERYGTWLSAEKRRARIVYHRCQQLRPIARYLRLRLHRDHRRVCGPVRRHHARHRHAPPALRCPRTGRYLRAACLTDGDGC